MGEQLSFDGYQLGESGGMRYGSMRCASDGYAVAECVVEMLGKIVALTDRTEIWF